MLLMDVVSSIENVNLIIHGAGIGDDLSTYKNTKQFKSIDLNTKGYKYEEMGELLRNTDLIWAAYPSKDFNVKYAISNKFFESFVFNIPAIYSNKTELGKLVSDNNIGFTVDPYSYNSIRSLLEKVKMNKNLLEEVKLSQLQFTKNELFWEEQEYKLVEFVQKLINEY